MKDSGEGKLHYARFALRWKNLMALKREKATLVLSPHLDDIFLSLYATISAGKLGSNIIGVNFFTASDSTVRTSVNTTFSTIVKTSLERTGEELQFSHLLFQKGINYLPVFLGLKEASIGKYYEFIAGGAIGRLSKKTGIRLSTGMYRKMVDSYARELELWKLLEPILWQFRSNIKNIVSPLGIYPQIDHGVVARSAIGSFGSARLGLYAEIPYTYMSGVTSVSKLIEKAPKGFSTPMVTKFDPAAKDRVFQKLYKSQYERRTKEAIFAVGKGLGEVILWKD